MSSGRCDEERLTVHLPDELPVLTPEVSRILLGILIGLTEVEAPDGASEEGSRDY